jgi:hypothetical protein
VATSPEHGLVDLVERLRLGGVEVERGQQLGGVGVLEEQPERQHAEDAGLLRRPPAELRPAQVGAQVAGVEEAVGEDRVHARAVPELVLDPVDLRRDVAGGADRDEAGAGTPAGGGVLGVRDQPQAGAGQVGQHLVDVGVAAQPGAHGRELVDELACQPAQSVRTFGRSFRVISASISAACHGAPTQPDGPRRSTPASVTTRTVPVPSSRLPTGVAGSPIVYV